MSRVLPYVTALAILVGSCLVHGHWTGRWSVSRELADRVAALDRVPLTIGDWRGRPLTLDARTLEAGGIDGYLMRRYENGRGNAVTALIVCGRPGPIAVHTPEVCYQGTGYEQTSGATRVPVAAGAGRQPDVFWSVDFGKPGPIESEHLRVLYAWSVTGSWEASSSPRLDFAGAPALCKMYVVRQTSGAEGPAGEGDPAVEFARQFLPELRKSLFAAP